MKGKFAFILFCFLALTNVAAHSEQFYSSEKINRNYK